jgi:2'-phosphotransferase
VSLNPPILSSSDRLYPQLTLLLIHLISRAQLAQPNLTTLSFPHLHHLVTSNVKQRFTLLYALDPQPYQPLAKKPVNEQPLVPVTPIPEIPAWEPSDASAANATSSPASSSTLPAGEWFIRAAQGHSLKTIEADQLLEEISQVDSDSLKKVGDMVHGTKWENWESIRETGLSRMNRQHVHLTTSRYNSTSGPRLRSDLFVYLSLPDLLSSDPPIKVYVSSNNVVLTPGNEEGRVPRELFKKVVRSRKEFVEVSEEGNSSVTGEATVVDPIAELDLEGKTGKAARRSRRVGNTRKVREWDEIIWEDGKAVEPPRVDDVDGR